MTPRPHGRTSSRQRAGFTLIEVLIALTVFAVAVLALAMVVPMAGKRIMKSGSQTRASSLASEAAEELLTVPYGDAMLTAGTHDDTANPHNSLYYVRWVVEDNVPVGHCKRITVKVARGSASALPEAKIVVVTPESGS